MVLAWTNKDLERRARKAGFQEEPTGNGHLKLHHPVTGDRFELSRSGGEWRGKMTVNALKAIEHAEQIIREAQPAPSEPLPTIPHVDLSHIEHIPQDQRHYVAVQRVLAAAPEKPISEFREAYLAMSGRELCEYFSLNINDVYFLRKLWSVPKKSNSLGRPKRSAAAAKAIHFTPAGSEPINHSELAKHVDIDMLVDRIMARADLGDLLMRAVAMKYVGSKRSSA